jgi:hypothetical protein
MRLDGALADPELTGMQTRFPPIAAAFLGTLLALAACHNQPTTIVPSEDDPQASQLKMAKPVAPPPMIQASRTYRCDDNSLLFADFYTNNTVSIRTAQNGGATILTAKDGKPPFTGPGYSLSANGAHIKFSAPGKASQGCDA